MHGSSVAVAFLLLCLRPVAGQAQLQLGSLFDDGAVLPRDAKVPVWGTAPAGTKVAVVFADQQQTVKAAAEPAVP